MKEFFVPAQLEVIHFNNADVITTSGYVPPSLDLDEGGSED